MRSIFRIVPDDFPGGRFPLRIKANNLAGDLLHSEDSTGKAVGFSFMYQPQEGLFLSDKDVDRCTTQIPAFADLVLQETFVRLLHILRKVRKEYKRRNLRIRQLSHIFDLDILTLV